MSAQIIQMMSQAFYRTCRAPSMVMLGGTPAATWQEEAQAFYLGEEEMLSFYRNRPSSDDPDKTTFMGVPVYQVAAPSHFQVVYK